jgi:protein pelota
VQNARKNQVVATEIGYEYFRNHKRISDMGTIDADRPFLSYLLSPVSALLLSLSPPMKLIKRHISAKDGSGSVVVRPETIEDIWHVYNLLCLGDSVRTTTLRKVVKETSTGSTSSSKKRLNLTISLKKIEFDPPTLRMSGITTSESDFVRLGSHHTLSLELNQNLTLEKPCWDQIYLDVLDESLHPEKSAEIAAITMQVGLAHVCVITGSLTITKQRIETTIPKKRTGSSSHAKAIQKFYEAIYQSILRHIDFTQIKCCLLASPGFVKDDFFKYLLNESVRREDRILIENKHKFILAKSSSGHKHALEEVLSDPNIMSQLTDTKFAQEVQVLNDFMRMMDTDPDKAYYGYHHVKSADDQLAIDKLLVTDSLFRNAQVKTRKLYVDLVESVRSHGGQVFVLSSMHVSGQQLEQVSGVAAILRYPLPDLEELEEIVAAADLVDEQMEQSDDEEYDPEARIREDMEDMGFS